MAQPAPMPGTMEAADCHRPQMVSYHLGPVTAQNPLPPRDMQNKETQQQLHNYTLTGSFTTRRRKSS